MDKIATKNFLFMIHFSSLKKMMWRRLLQICFFITILFSFGCNSKKPPLFSACLTKEEKADLECFFRLVMFENYGAFVLFGSKPICEMRFRDEECDPRNSFEKWLDSLPDDQREEFLAKIKQAEEKQEIVAELERNPYRGWLALEKVFKVFKPKNFIFKIVPVHYPNKEELIPGSYELTLINMQQTSLVLAENYELFKKAAEMDFDPIKMVFEFQNKNSLFWERMFYGKNSVTTGLLFGFGLKNSTFFHWKFSDNQYENKDDIKSYFLAAPFDFSADPVPYHTGSLSNFTIPVFRAVPGDDTVEKYKKEQAAIKKIYQGRDMVEVTLQRLVGSEPHSK